MPTKNQPFECLSIEIVGDFIYYKYKIYIYRRLIVGNPATYAWSFLSKQLPLSTVLIV